LTRSAYLNEILAGDKTEAGYKNNYEYVYKYNNTKYEKWNTNYELGLLHIYIDDMYEPYLSTVVNMGEMVERDDFFTTLNGSTAGEAYVSLSASTQNSQRSNTHVMTSFNADRDSSIINPEN